MAFSFHRQTLDYPTILHSLTLTKTISVLLLTPYTDPLGDFFSQTQSPWEVNKKACGLRAANDIQKGDKVIEYAKSDQTRLTSNTAMLELSGVEAR